MFNSVGEIGDLLREGGYIADEEIATAVFLSLQMEKPILVEGPPGVGKTSLAKTMANILDIPLLRLQCYEGVDESKALYDWEYGKQMLYTQLLRSQLDIFLADAGSLKGAIDKLSREESLFFSENFLHKRPVLQSFMTDRRAVLLIDEIDRADDEFEALLLECLSDYQVSIPELGVIKARKKPLVILTSNNTRLLSDALRRRCLYLYIGYPELEREIEIVRKQVPKICQSLAENLVKFLRKVREAGLRKPPSISETIDWARVLSLLKINELSFKVVKNTAGSFTKHAADLEKVEEFARQELV
jgi:MoxR-like ATPase